MLQIDMEMPACCRVCPMFDDRWDYPTCSVNNKSMGYTFNPFLKRMPTCPLKERKEWIEVEDDLEYYPFMCPVCNYQSLYRLTSCPECGAQLM